ncbi:MAG TPA: alpha/beta fold hydrolase [Marmoricola sp.]|nr:alpha/beta fold hydrolase [Marmoricola sp.]
MAYFPYDVQEDLGRLGLAHSYVDTRLGRLRVARSPGSIETLFLHGVGLDSSAWSPLIEAAGSVSGWACLDLPGFGGSAALAHGFSLDEASGALLDALDGLGASAVDVVGHSMGGFLGLHLAAVHPERVRSLTIVCGAYATIVDVVNAPVRTLLRRPRTAVIYLGLMLLARLGAVGDLIVRFGARTGLLRLSMPGVAAHPFRVRRSLLHAIAAGNRPQSFRDAQATGIGYDYRSVWSRISVPVVAIFGDHDALVSRRDADVLASCLPSARIEYLNDASHFAPMEQPEELMRLLPRAAG